MFHNFLFLQCDVVFGIVNAFSRIFDAVSSENFDAFLVTSTYIAFRTVFPVC